MRPEVGRPCPRDGRIGQSGTKDQGVRLASKVLLARSMAHPLRWYLPGTMFEVTTRTLQERYFLRPSSLCRALIIGVLARAQQMYPAVRIYAFTFLSNHYHLMC